MEHKPVNNELKMLSATEMSELGWEIPSIKQFTKNMENRLKKVRGEEDNRDSFLIRHNYESGSNSCQAY